MSTLRRRASGEGTEFVTCRLCQREFRMVGAPHLIRRHDYDPEHPVLDYLARFRNPPWQATDTLQKRRRSVIRFYEKVGRRWDRRRLLRMVRDRHRRGLPLSIRAMNKVSSGAIQGARATFGGWNILLRAAGMDVRPRTRWNRELVLRTLQEEADKGSDLSSTGIQVRFSGLYNWACEHFDSWEEALRAAEIDPDKHRKRRVWTPRTLLEHIRRFGRPLRQEEILKVDPGLFSATRSYFGSWLAALRRAGYQPPPRLQPPKWSGEIVIESIRRRAIRGLSLNSSIVCHGESGLLVAARQHFKTWREAIRAAGCEKYYPSRRSWTREELLDFFQRVRRKHGYVSAGLLRRLSRPGYIPPMSAVKRLFGVIGNAKRAIGATEDGRSFWKR